MENEKDISKKIDDLITITETYISDTCDNNQKAKERINHSKVVRGLCCILGAMNKLGKDDFVDLQIAGLMHDICKFEEKDIHSYLSASKSYDIVKNTFNDIERAKRVCDIIATHSNKEYIDRHMTLNQKLLINADIISKLVIDDDLLLLYKSDVKQMDKVINKVKKQRKVIRNLPSLFVYMEKMKTFKKVRKTIIEINKKK